MKYKSYNYIYLIIILVCSLYFSIIFNETESFTPGLRRIYKPYLRHARISYENFSNNYYGKINKIFKNVGLY
jgi:hypothetical protein